VGNQIKMQLIFSIHLRDTAYVAAAMV